MPVHRLACQLKRYKKTFMKTKVIIAALVTVATASGIYFYKKWLAKKNVKSQPIKKNHHLTRAFARAKDHALNGN